jgi:hypothetical protein
VPLPAKFVIRFLPPVYPPAAGDPEAGPRLATRVRGQIQDNLYEMLAQRRSAWFANRSQR